MTVMVPIALFGWIPAILLIFKALPPRRAVIISFIGAWMFLPSTGYDVSGLPEYTKATATSLGVLLAIAIFDSGSLRSVRLRLLDTPMLLWCLCPLASSLSNGLGLYDGVSAVFDHVVTWGLPYWIGRAYLRNLDDLRELAVCLFIGGLLYIPFCVWEIRMSPQLNRYVYGFGGAGTEYAKELGKWGSRPRVFMGTALTVGTFMTAASLVGMWMWTARCLGRLWGFSAGALVIALVLTTIMCKNMGALSLLLFGSTTLFAVKWSRTLLPVCLLILAPVFYMGARATGMWSARSLVDIAGHVHERRAASIESRLENEEILVDKALQRLVFGWGGWGRARVYDERGRDISVTDGMWIIALGNNGVTGLVASTSVLLLPVLILMRRYPARCWVEPAVAPCVALAVLVVLFMVDNLFNAMFNPIYIVTAGGLVRLVTTRTRSPLNLNLQDSGHTHHVAVLAGNNPIVDGHSG